MASKVRQNKDRDDYENMQNLDLCGFVADYLINSLDAYKKEEIKKCPGCLHLFHVIFADHALISSMEPPPSGVPRIKHIADTHLKCVANVWNANKYVNLPVRTEALNDNHAKSINSSPQSSHKRINTTLETTSKPQVIIDQVEKWADERQAASEIAIYLVRGGPKAQEDNAMTGYGRQKENGTLDCVPTTAGALRAIQDLVDETLVNQQVETEASKGATDDDLAPSICNMTTNMTETSVAALRPGRDSLLSSASQVMETSVTAQSPDLASPPTPSDSDLVALDQGGRGNNTVSGVDGKGYLDSNLASF